MSDLAGGAGMSKRSDGSAGTDAMKVAVCEYLLRVNEEHGGPFIPPTAIDWLGNGIVSAILEASANGPGPETDHQYARDPACVARWPECVAGTYDPRCCRFPKSCSCSPYDGPGADPVKQSSEAEPYAEPELSKGSDPEPSTDSTGGYRPCGMCATGLPHVKSEGCMDGPAHDTSTEGFFRTPPYPHADKLGRATAVPDTGDGTLRIAPDAVCRCGHTHLHHVFGACDVSRGGERVDDCEGFVLADDPERAKQEAIERVRRVEGLPEPTPDVSPDPNESLLRRAHDLIQLAGMTRPSPFTRGEMLRLHQWIEDYAKRDPVASSSAVPARRLRDMRSDLDVPEAKWYGGMGGKLAVMEKYLGELLDALEPGHTEEAGRS